eukprot:TRINITY_DN2583_c0_g2_i9.p1 TRINITY_DN2583_c0_g2~~TRINITY_DN2583_c0_g2_i9.p1  ORF type:complete len:198 (-),score=36.45 TRINITY_DN2583_c0_g2_i9:376-969(-)
MCIRDRYQRRVHGILNFLLQSDLFTHFNPLMKSKDDRKAFEMQVEALLEHDDEERAAQVRLRTTDNYSAFDMLRSSRREAPSVGKYAPTTSSRNSLPHRTNITDRSPITPQRTTLPSLSPAPSAPKVLSGTKEVQRSAAAAKVFNLNSIFCTSPRPKGPHFIVARQAKEKGTTKATFSGLRPRVLLKGKREDEALEG